MHSSHISSSHQCSVIDLESSNSESMSRPTGQHCESKPSKSQSAMERLTPCQSCSIMPPKEPWITSYCGDIHCHGCIIKLIWTLAGSSEGPLVCNCDEITSSARPLYSHNAEQDPEGPEEARNSSDDNHAGQKKDATITLQKLIELAQQSIPKKFAALPGLDKVLFSPNPIGKYGILL